uniref:Uncharacterized protein n=2 Tax=Myotis myotis TaxID=51298 RepID=A0A7J7VYP6_MYOMY|nr:hypothetical protein mMyoMyo1_012194 [Myotis myotis]
MEREMERGPAWEQTPGCGARTGVRKPSTAGGRFPCARSSRVSAAENGPVPLPREARLSPTSGCADAPWRRRSPACMRPLLEPAQALLSLLSSVGAAPAFGVWFVCLHLRSLWGMHPFLALVWAGPSLTHPLTGIPPEGVHGLAVRSQQGPSPQSGCQRPDVCVFLLLGCSY